ncbi:DNA-directed RNA polymerase V subunit 5C isoform X1 [Euphorbia lathyris]|uniref:DNA-directed RNA polymerase V subunit 5C isoform X1 n=1 Tax=Euphorbia lathyris TaxID=212925 RepID=UPI003313E1F2
MASTGGYGTIVGDQCLTKFVDGGSVESLRYYLSRRTVLEMLRDRGYSVPEPDLTRSLSEFRTEFYEGDKINIERLRISASLPSNPYENVLVVFMGTEEIKKADIGRLNNQISNKESLKRLILVLQNKMNHFAKKELLKWTFPVEIFQITELLSNITKHLLQPKYEMLTTAQKQQLLNEYKAEEKQLPRMVKDDAIARYYGLKKGQVLKVSYKGGIVDSIVTYRCII